MHILVADAFPESGLEHLTGGGHQVSYQPALTDVGTALDGIEVLVVRSTRVDAGAIARGTDLSLIVRAGAGTNNIDKAAAAARAVYVSNVPGRNAVAVAELTLGLILAIDRRIPDNVADLRVGAWNKRRYSDGTGLWGRRLGIVGLGAIGRAVAIRARAFGLTLHGLDKPRHPTTRRELGDLGFALHPDLTALAASVDILSLHVPASPETRHLVDANLLGALAPGSVLINTSRADVVDEAALLLALDTGDLWAGLDVFADEPAGGDGTIESALARHPRVYGTHHIGASTAQAQAAVADGVLEVIDAFTAGTVLNCVNLQPHIPDTTRITVRHRDRVGVLASILMHIRDAGLNVEHMSNLVFEGAEAASATIDLKGPVTAELLERLAELPDVIHARRNS